LTRHPEVDNNPAVDRPAALPNESTSPSDDEAVLRSWDWLAELESQERDRMWLARHVHTHYRKVYRYASGELTPPVEWLREVARVLAVSL
jgi:hypothetical protein